MEKEFSLTRLRNCGFVRAGEVRIADLIYLNGYVPFCVKNIQDRLTPCSTRHFAIVTNGTRTREMPLAVEHHQILNTEWGLGRVRPPKGETIVTENSLPSLAEALPITVMYSSSSETTVAHLS